MTQELDLVGALMTMRMKMDKLYSERLILARTLVAICDREGTSFGYREGVALADSILEENEL